MLDLQADSSPYSERVVTEFTKTNEGGERNKNGVCPYEEESEES